MTLDKRTEAPIIASGDNSNLADKLASCTPQHRCGSLGCLKCGRAIQKAKAAASQACLSEIAKSKGPTKRLVMVTCVPTWLRYDPKDLRDLQFAKCNEWLLRTFAEHGFKRTMLGSIDVSLEDGFYQPHWHFAMWTANPDRLTERLKAIFPSYERYDRPVHVAKAYSLDFLLYTHKCIKVVDLLRRNRRDLSNVISLLDRTPPKDTLVLGRLSLRVTNGRFLFEASN